MKATANGPEVQAMSDPHDPHVTTGPSQGHEAAAGHGLPFSEADWQQFHKDDVGAGGAVIVLMTAIFSIGLVLYAIIAVVVAS
jgi:hypothetical protein